MRPLTRFQLPAPGLVDCLSAPPPRRRREPGIAEWCICFTPGRWRRQLASEFKPRFNCWLACRKLFANRHGRGSKAVVDC